MTAPCSLSVRTYFASRPGCCELPEGETWRPLVAPDIPQHFRPLARFPFLLLWENKSSVLRQREKRNAVPTLGISTSRVPLGSFSAWFDMKTHSFRKQRMRIPVPSLFLSTFFRDSRYACGLQSGKVRPRSVTRFLDRRRGKLKDVCVGRMRIPLLHYYFPHFLCCAIQKALTCTTNMAAYTRN